VKFLFLIDGDNVFICLKIHEKVFQSKVDFCMFYRMTLIFKPII